MEAGSIKNQQKNVEQNTVEFNIISQQLVMQKLSHYFLTPTSKTIPYQYYFRKHQKSMIYSLTYLYNFIRAVNHSKVINQIFVEMLPIQPEQNGDDMVESKQKAQKNIRVIMDFEYDNWNSGVTRKILIGRYMGLASSMAEYLASKKIKCRRIQVCIVESVCKCIEQLNQQQKLYVINKIIMLGYFNIFFNIQIGNNTRLKNIVNNYELIVKKQTVIMQLFKHLFDHSQLNQSQSAKVVVSALHQLIHKYHSQSSNHNIDTISKLLHQPTFEPHHAKLVYQTVIQPFPLLRKSIFQDLLLWWTEGNDQYLIYNTIKFRTNLFALSIMDFNKNDIIQFSGLISLGIQRRLLIATENKKQVVNLIWAILAKALQFQLPPHFTTQLLQSDIRMIEKQLEKTVQKQNLQKSTINISLNKDRQEQADQSQQKQELEQTEQIVIKRPRNLYDCILGLKNTSRRKITLQVMPNLIRANPQDLIFMWKDLVNELIYNLNNDTQQSVKALFVTRPQHFIQSISQIFFNRDHSLNDKIIIMQVIQQGTEQLANKPIAAEVELKKDQFYFKKITSKYYNDDKLSQQKQNEQKDYERTRRWGHTRIAHDKKIKQKQTGVVSLKIIDNQPYVNRLYQIANQLFFRLVSKFALLPIFPSQPMFSYPMLKMLATLSYNLRNHIQKYKILSEVTDICLHVIQCIQNSNKKVSQANLRANNLKKWKDTSLALLNALNKVSLVVDKYIPNRMLQVLQKCIIKLKSSPQYGINPIINMIEANIYTNVSGNKVHF